MTRPGHRVRTIAACMCSPQAMDRLIDPMLADLQAEYAEAVRRGRVWRSRWVRVAGYVTFVKMMALCGFAQSMRAMRDWTPDDRRDLSRMIGVALAAVMTMTALLQVPPLMVVSWRRGSQAAFLGYLIPQALPLAVPVGFTIGLVFGLGGRAISRRLISAVLAIAVVCSVASFVTLAWVIPAANQAFRVSVSGRTSVMKGLNELTLGELRQLLKPGTGEPIALLPPRNVRYLAINYHTRWALSGATFVFALFALSVLTRSPVGRLILVAVTCGACLGYYFLLLAGAEAGRQGALPPFAAAWLPNVVFVVVAATLLNLAFAAIQPTFAARTAPKLDVIR